jgi:hypothetical protein
VAAKPEGEDRRQEESEVSSLTVLTEQTSLIARRLDNLMNIFLPDPEVAHRTELVELRQKNKELEISLYVLGALFFLMLLANRR